MIENINLNSADVTAELHGYMYDGIFNAHGVFNVGNQLSHTVATNNEITLADGLLCNQGRFMRIVGSESVTIENGASGVTRVDLIVAHFETDGINETHDIRVIKGAAGGVIPAHEEDDIYNGGTTSDLVLYKITLEGLNIKKVEAQFELIEPLEKAATNPNILINSDFRNPVNTRGKTTYTGSEDGTVKAIDKWHISKSSAARTCEIADGYIKLTNSNASYAFTFECPLEKPLPEDTYTYSVYVKALTGSASARAGVSDSEAMGLAVGINTMTITGEIDHVRIGVQPSSSVELYWCKLEGGNKATPFIARTHEEELVLCDGNHSAEIINRVVRGDATTTNYVKFAEVEVKGAYVNCPINIELSQRTSSAGELALEFKSVSTTDPDLSVFAVRGWPGCSAPQIYASKLGTSKWGLYIKKHASYDYVNILRMKKSTHSAFEVEVTWTDVEIETLAEGYIEATREPNIRVLTQTEYDALTPDENTLYFITE